MLSRWARAERLGVFLAAVGTVAFSFEARDVLAGKLGLSREQLAALGPLLLTRAVLKNEGLFEDTVDAVCRFTRTQFVHDFLVGQFRELLVDEVLLEQLSDLGEQAALQTFRQDEWMSRQTRFLVLKRLEEFLGPREAISLARAAIASQRQKRALGRRLRQQAREVDLQSLIPRGRPGAL